MTQEKTVEVGGEILMAGKTVVVCGGPRSREEREISRIGSKYLYVKQGHREEPFDIKTRMSATSTRGSGSRFMTHTEAARADKRQALVLGLREFGLQSTKGPLDPLGQYSDEALEEIIEVLSKHRNSVD